MPQAEPILKGRCLCGAVKFSIEQEPFEAPTSCHCSQCRMWSGHAFAAVSVPRESLKIDDPDGHLCWFASSDVARRGFCGRCGTSLFWDGHGLPAYNKSMEVAMGALLEPTSLKLGRHIFCAYKGDYYDISDDLPQFAEVEE